MARGRKFLEGLLLRRPGWLVALSLSLVLPLAALAAHSLSAGWAAEQQRQALDEAKRQLLARQLWTETEFDAYLMNRRALPALLAQDDRLAQLLQRPDDQGLRDAVNAYLAHSAPLGQVDRLWLLDQQDFCLAASNHRAADSLVGSRDGRARSRPGETGLLHAAAVRDERGRILGSLVAEVSMSALARRLDLRQGFISDDWGLILLASSPAWQGLALPEAALWRQPAAQREARYQRQHFMPLTLQTQRLADQDVLQVGGTGPWVYQRLALGPEGMALHLLQPLHGLEGVAAAQTRAFWLLLLGGLLLAWLAAGSAVFALRGRLHARQMRDKNDELARLNLQLSQQAQTDALTGCVNRRRLHELLDIELQRLRRQPGRPLALALLDIDHFKTVNDRHGHAVGDQALQHFATLMRQGVRGSDVLARVGGEEFVLLMLDTGLPAAQSLLERLRASLPLCPLQLAKGQSLSLSVSIGLTALLPGDTSSDLMVRADEALYAAKNGGRNRVSVQAAALARPAVASGEAAEAA